MAKAVEPVELTPELLARWEQENIGPPGDDYGMWHAGEIAALIAAARQRTELQAACQSLTSTLSGAWSERDLWKRRYYMAINRVAADLGNNVAHRVNNAILSQEKEGPDA